MFFERLFGRGLGLSPGEVMRNEHSAWLTQALATRRDLPRIPVRPVEDGGFGKLMSLPNGADLAAKWWRVALDRFE